MSDQSLPDIPLPTGWAKNVKSAVLHVISLANFAIVATRGWAAYSINDRVRLSSDNNQAQQEIELLREELRIKDTRLAKIDPRRRPARQYRGHRAEAARKSMAYYSPPASWAGTMSAHPIASDVGAA